MKEFSTCFDLNAMQYDRDKVEIPWAFAFYYKLLYSLFKEKTNRLVEVLKGQFSFSFIYFSFLDVLRPY